MTMMNDSSFHPPFILSFKYLTMFQCNDLKEKTMRGWIKDGKGEAQTLIFILGDHAVTSTFGVQSCCWTERTRRLNLSSSSNETEFHLLSWEIIIIRGSDQLIPTWPLQSCLLLLPRRANEPGHWEGGKEYIFAVRGRELERRCLLILEKVNRWACIPMKWQLIQEYIN